MFGKYSPPIVTSEHLTDLSTIFVVTVIVVSHNAIMCSLNKVKPGSET